jgi:hypothetical protein
MSRRKQSKRSDMPLTDGPDHRRDPRRNGRADTLAWLWAAFQIVAPILVALIVVVLLAYGLFHVLFLR